MIAHRKRIDVQTFQQLFRDIRHNAGCLSILICVAVRQVCLQISYPEFVMRLEPFRLCGGMCTAGKTSGIVFHTEGIKIIRLLHRQKRLCCIQLLKEIRPFDIDRKIIV